MEELVSRFRSGPSKTACGLQFQNHTIRAVSIIWLDYSGNEKTYFILKPLSVKSVFSFEGHVWICRDAVSKRCLLLNNKEVLIPTFSKKQMEDGTDLFPIFKVYISIPSAIGLKKIKQFIFKCDICSGLGALSSYEVGPEGQSKVFSLQDICSDLISQHISNENDIRILEVPTSMKDLIVDCFRNATS